MGSPAPGSGPLLVLCDPKPSIESAPPRLSNSGALEHWGAEVQPALLGRLALGLAAWGS